MVNWSSYIYLTKNKRETRVCSGELGYKLEILEIGFMVEN